MEMYFIIDEKDSQHLATIKCGSLEELERNLLDLINMSFDSYDCWLKEPVPKTVLHFSREECHISYVSNEEVTDTALTIHRTNIISK